MQRLNLGAIATGVLVSFFAAITLNFLLRLATGGSLPFPWNLTFFAVISGPLLAFLLGGYAAGRIAGRWGGLNGIMVVLINFLLTFAFASLIISLAILSASRSGSVGVGTFYQESNTGSSLSRSLLGAALVVAYLALMLMCDWLGGRLGECHASNGGRGS